MIKSLWQGLGWVAGTCPTLAFPPWAARTPSCCSPSSRWFAAQQETPAPPCPGSRPCAGHGKGWFPAMGWWPLGPRLAWPWQGL